MICTDFVTHIDIIWHYVGMLAVETSHSLDSLSTQLIVGFLLNAVMQYWTYFGQSWTTERLILDKAGTTRGGKLWPSASFCSQKRGHCWLLPDDLFLSLGSSVMIIAAGEPD